MNASLCRGALLFAAFGVLCGQARAEPQAQPQALQVLHWWTSASERAAADVLASRLALEHIEWRDAAIPGGAGVGASKVLKSRLLAGRSPEVIQLIGVNLAQWAELGLLLQLDEVSRGGHWQAQMYPTVWRQVRLRGHSVAAPLGIHRINTLFYNPKLFARLHLAPPRTWAEFEHAAAEFQRAGITPLAQSGEPWQVATLFETLLLAESGPAYYRAVFVDNNAQALADPRLRHALTRLRSLRRWMPAPLLERPWTEVARQFGAGGAAMFIMGDWVKGELNGLGLVTGTDFACAAAPDTEAYHLYSIDTLAMFAADYGNQAQQEKFAQVLTAPATQASYNRIKGSIPVLRAAAVSGLDACAQASAQAFARGDGAQAPSLVHRMATDEARKDAIIAEVQRFFNDQQVSAADTQRRLVAMLLALPGKEKGNDDDAQDPGS
jgi:glucose/mannose transport system substrate-binding protein